MLPRVLGSYGAPYNDAKPVVDPTTEIASALFNLLTEDTAQMTRVARKILLHFPTVAAGNSTPSYTETMWGTGAQYYPTTVTRTGAGLYTITYPTSFTDGLGNVEAFSLTGGFGCVESATVLGSVQVSCTSNVINVVTYQTVAGGAVDLTAGTTIRIEAR